MAEFNMENLKESFEEAAQHVKSLVGSLKDEQLLKLYSRYKQATVGTCNTPKPHVFDFQGRSKWSAWSQLGNMSQEDAMKEYISIIDSLDVDWRSKVTTEGDNKQSGSFGISVSTMEKVKDEIIKDDDKTIFDWCKEGNLEQLKKRLAKNDSNVNSQDEEGISLLHWASDRGYEDIVQYLLSQKVSIDQQDADGQTALHYACICEYQEIVKMLLKHGANPNVKDTSDSTPADNTDNQKIHSLLREKINCLT